MNKLYRFDRQCRRKRSIVCVAGIDEAGRGPLAGPVVAAAVIFPETFQSKNIQDSKKLTSRARDKCYALIARKALSIGVSVVQPGVIDTINIFQATYLAMARAVRKLSPKPQLLLVDGPFTIPKLKHNQEAVVRGDARSISIAAASIIAKVTRDRIMMKLDKKYPLYGFSRNKGYPTREHRDAVRKYGVTPVHRRSFTIKGKKDGQREFSFNA